MLDFHFTQPLSITWDNSTSTYPWHIFFTWHPGHLIFLVFLLPYWLLLESLTWFLRFFLRHSAPGLSLDLFFSQFSFTFMVILSGSVTLNSRYSLKFLSLNQISLSNSRLFLFACLICTLNSTFPKLNLHASFLKWFHSQPSYIETDENSVFPVVQNKSRGNITDVSLTPISLPNPSRDHLGFTFRTCPQSFYFLPPSLLPSGLSSHCVLPELLKRSPNLPPCL